MATLVRWNPTRTMNLFNEFDRFFDEALAAPTRRYARSWGLPLDVIEDETGYTVKASIPGITPDDLNITLEDNVLTIQGEMKGETETEGVRYHLRERRQGSFSRSINFPLNVNSDAVAASYENGVLTLNIPKAEAVKPKRIEIKTPVNN